MANEKRLIEADALRTLFDDIPPFIGMTGGCVQQYIDKAPTVDAVILPPVKTGDTAYFVLGGKVYKAEVYFVRWEQHKLYGIHSEITASIVPNYSVGASFDDFGKTVFLTREEAEAALAKMDGDGNG